jgi:hypothetical protein
MKRFLLTVFALCCAAFLFLGNMYWKERTTISGHEEAGTAPVKIASVKEEPAKEKESPPTGESKDLDVLISNWPEDSQRTFNDAIKNGETYKIAIVGSPALGEEENGSAPQLQEALMNEYDNQIEVTIFQSDVTSIEFINGEEADDVLAFEPDLVLFEPFSLNDNSNSVGVVQNHESILMFQRQLLEVNNDCVLLLQPPHPLDGAIYYPQDIEALKEFAEAESIPYLDHWTAWPEDDTLADYLSESQETPNAQGYEIWTDYLTDYFIND